MKRFALLVAAIFLTASIFTGCEKEPKKDVLYVYNWGTFIDPVVNERFEEEYNCKVIYENYASNEEMYLKLKNSNTAYDVIFPSDYMIEKLIKEDMLLPIRHENIPNMRNIMPQLLNQSFDPGNIYSVPYFWGTVGILYNSKIVTEQVRNWDILWNEKYAKEILMYDSQRDSIAVALKELGYSLNSRDMQEINEARDLLRKQKPLVLAYVTDNVMGMMIGEEAALSVVYSGDAVYCMMENKDLKYVVPEEGSNLWFDNIAIPSSSQNKELAEKYINFLCQDDISYLNTIEVGYTTPNKNLEKELRKEDWLNNETYFIPEKDMENCEIFHDPGDFINNYANAWEEVRIEW